MSLIIPANTLASGGFAVDNSCRFNDASPDILKNGTESDGNRKVWTMSMWIKRSKLGVRQSLWSWGSNSSSTGEIYIDANDFLVLNNDGQQGSSNEVEGVLRDTSAWYHIVWRCDVTETDNIDRWRVYINGVQRTLTDAATVTNADGEINKNATHENWIGGAARSLQSGNPIYPFGGYIAEAVFVDGQALAPTEFGEFDEDSGIWKPISVSGLTFGDEGVYLNFENAAELGTDVSGNGNTYAETGLTAIDQTTDTPTNNFATGNPLAKNTNVVLSEGNLKITNASGGDSYAGGTFGLDVGKWYWENRKNGTGNTSVGIVLSTADISTSSTVTAKRVIYNANGAVYKEGAGGGSTSTGYTYADGDIIGIALDRENGTIKFYKNETLVNTTTDSALSSSDNTWIPLWSIDSGGEFEANFGNPTFTGTDQSDGNSRGSFEYEPPEGYLSLCTANLSEVLG